MFGQKSSKCRILQSEGRIERNAYVHRACWSVDCVELMKMKDEALSKRFDRIPCLIVDNPICPRRPLSYRIRYQTRRDEGGRGTCIFQRACTVCFVQSNRCPLSDVEPFNFLESCIYRRVAETANENERGERYFCIVKCLFLSFCFFSRQRGNRRDAFLRGTSAFSGTDDKFLSCMFNILLAIRS